MATYEQGVGGFAISGRESTRPSEETPKTHGKIDAARFYAALQSRTDVASCASLFKETVAPLGFDTIACGEVDLVHRDRNVFYHLDWPESWIDYYTTSGFIDRDPVLNALKPYRGAFTWSDIIKDRRFAKLEREALRQGARHGWNEGLVVPVSRGGERYGIVSLIGRSKVTARSRAPLCLVSECFLGRVRALGGKREFPIPPAGLSDREIESVRLVALGYSDAKIGEALGISHSTAHKHVEASRKRLKAKTRAEMTAIALSLGIVDGA